MSRKSATSIPGIYKIANLVTGTVYIGQAVNIRKRWEVHRKGLSSGKHHNGYLLNAWRKYGSSSFEFAIVRDMSHIPQEELAAALNSAEIEILSSFSDTYNLMEAGLSGMVAGPETRALWSEQRKAMWSDIDFKQKRADETRALHQDPEYSAKRAASIKEGLNTPEAKQKRSEISKRLWSDPEFRARMAAKKKANWQDPEYKIKQSESRKASWANQESRNKRVAALKASASDPDVRAARQRGISKVRAQIGSSHKALWSDPAYRAKMAEARKEGHARRAADPLYRAQHSERMRAYWARKKAASAGPSPSIVSPEDESKQP